MKNKIKLLTVSVFVIVLAAFACTNNEAPKNTATTPNSNNAANGDVDKQTYKSVGVIKNIDAGSGRVTIDHEDIPGYMAAMEMNEPVGDKSILTNLKVGDKVDFEIERTGSKVTVTKLNKIGEVALLNGAEIYKANCAECHGANGEGAKKGIPFTSGHALHHSESEFIEQVTNGEGKKMPAFKDKLATAEIAEVVRFVRTEIQKGAVKEEKGGHHH